MKEAVKIAGLHKKYRVGRDWKLTGTVALHLRWGTPKDAGTKSKIDYRYAGQYPGGPSRTEIEKALRHNGVMVFRPVHLVHKKLQTLIGDRSRQKARDIYDAGWVVNEKPELLARPDIERLKNWEKRITRWDIVSMTETLGREPVIGRVDARTVIDKMRTGIRKLNVDRAAETPDKAENSWKPPARRVEQVRRRRRRNHSRGSNGTIVTQETN